MRRNKRFEDSNTMEGSWGARIDDLTVRLPGGRPSAVREYRQALLCMAFRVLLQLTGPLFQRLDVLADRRLDHVHPRRGRFEAAESITAAVGTQAPWRMTGG
jgi:hypothetical protein